jgi:hypothetical protein
MTQNSMSGRILALVALALLAACDSSPSQPSEQLNLTGTWSGVLGQPRSGEALRLTWTATQSGDIVAGPATLVKPVISVPAVGGLTGRLTGNQLTLIYAVTPGAVPGFPNCSIVGFGGATVEGSTMTGTLTLNITSCSGSGLETPDGNTLTLAKS